ncbi:MAG: HTH-type transcriptional regulator CysL [Syntrophaceae bacterium PtaB.Bin038]|nr:MAG: HTH-type transcriptional regulator CysL [Syntrophaceae bacterium PtaB.Bin038]
MQAEMKNVNMLQLESLVHLVEERSFSRAAKRMFLSQPSLTKHIRNLEGALGAKVVNRASRAFTLTPEGRVVYDYARRILKLREEAMDRVMRVREREEGDIRIAASTIPATYILPPAIAGFLEKFRSIRTAVQAADSSEVIETVLENGAEIGFIGKEPAGAKLAAERLWRDRMVLAVPAAHPWARRKSVRVREIEKEPFVIREKGSGTREAFERCLTEAGKADLSRFLVVAEMGSSEAVKEAVIAGVGVSVLSLHAVRREVKSGVLAALSVEGCPIERHFHLIYRRQFDLMAHHKRFLEYIRAYRPPGP